MTTTLPRPQTLELRSALATVPTPLALIAAMVDGRPTGMVVGSFVGLSLEPPLVAFSPQLSSRTWPLIRDARELGVSILAAPHAESVYQLGGPTERRFRDVSWRAGDNGAVFLTDAATTFAGRLRNEFNVGDHSLAIIRVEHAGFDPDAAALVFHNSQVTTPAVEVRP